MNAETGGVENRGTHERTIRVVLKADPTNSLDREVINEAFAKGVTATSCYTGTELTLTVNQKKPTEVPCWLKSYVDDKLDDNTKALTVLKERKQALEMELKEVELSTRYRYYIIDILNAVKEGIKG